MQSKTYCAFIGDMNKSRTLPNRGRVQQKFKKTIETLNKEFKSAIASKFVLTLGDEFQGLLKSPEESYRFGRRCQELMGAVAFSFGVGIGTLSTPLNARTALGMDGEAFHRARAALQYSKKHKHHIWFDFDNPAVGLVNALVGSLEKGWTLLNPKQQMIAELMRKDQRQVVVARKLKVTQQYISKALRTTTMNEMIDAETALQKFLGALKCE
jgi:hypothetical protein